MRGEEEGEGYQSFITLLYAYLSTIYLYNVSGYGRADRVE